MKVIVQAVLGINEMIGQAVLDMKVTSGSGYK